MQTTNLSSVFSRETMDAWKTIFTKRQSHRTARNVLVVTLLHALCLWLLIKLPPAIDLSEIKKGAPSVSVRFVEPSRAQAPSVRTTPQPQQKREVLRERPREWLTVPESRIAVPVAPPIKAPLPVGTRPPVDIGPQMVSPSLNQLLPNSSSSLSNNARRYGEGWGQQNDETGDGDAGQAIDVQTREFKYASYFQGLIRQIEQVWVYPELAARSGMQGQAIYDIVIRRDGSLQKLVAVKSSGFLVLDSEVERAVREAGPYNPIPSRIDRDPLVIRIRFVYTLTRFGIF